MPFHTMLDIISTTALVPYQEKERMYVYIHTQVQLQWWCRIQISM